MRREAFIVCAALLAGTGPAWASGCTLTGNAPTVTASAIAFSNYSASAALPKQANGTIQIKCPLGIGLLPSFDVALSAGTSLSYAPRQMAMVTNRLGYNIYTSSGYSTVWGDGTGGTVTQSFSAILSLGTISFTEYGQIPTGEYVASGMYSDSVTVTVTY